MVNFYNMKLPKMLKEILAIFLISFGVSSIIYFFSWNLSSTGNDGQFLKEEKEYIEESFNEISKKMNKESVIYSICRADISIILYQLNKDVIESEHRYKTLYYNLSHTNSLFFVIMFMIFSGLFFSIYQMATAYTTKQGTDEKIEIEAAQIKVKTGYVSIAVSVISIIALSVYLANAHEVKQLDASENTAWEVDFGGLVKNCSERADQRQAD